MSEANGRGDAARSSEGQRGVTMGAMLGGGGSGRVCVLGGVRVCVGGCVCWVCVLGVCVGCVWDGRCTLLQSLERLGRRAGGEAEQRGRLLGRETGVGALGRDSDVGSGREGNTRAGASWDVSVVGAGGALVAFAELLWCTRGHDTAHTIAHTARVLLPTP